MPHVACDSNVIRCFAVHWSDNFNWRVIPWDMFVWAYHPKEAPWPIPFSHFPSPATPTPTSLRVEKVGIPCLTLQCGVCCTGLWSMHISCSSLVISSAGSWVKVSRLSLFSYPLQASNCHYMFSVARHDNAPFQVPSSISVCGVSVNQLCSNASSLLTFQQLLLNVLYLLD